MNNTTIKLLLVVALFGLIACESDEKKLARLENERMMACLIAEADSALEDSVQSAIDGSAQRKALTKDSMHRLRPRA